MFALAARLAQARSRWSEPLQLHSSLPKGAPLFIIHLSARRATIQLSEPHTWPKAVQVSSEWANNNCSRLLASFVWFALKQGQVRRRTSRINHAALSGAN